MDDLKEDVISLNDDSFMVKRHLRYVEFFRASSSWDNLETIEISDIREHIAPLIRPKKEDELARRFDYLVYSIDLAKQKHTKSGEYSGSDRRKAVCQILNPTGGKEKGDYRKGPDK